MSAVLSPRAEYRLSGLLACLVIVTAPQTPAAELTRPETSEACVHRGLRAPDLPSHCYVTSSDGVSRTFRLYVPPSARAGAPLPLVLVLHGGGGDGAGMERLTEGAFERIADRDALVVAYPDGIGRGWNDGRMGVPSRSASQHVNDLGFLRALPAAIGRLTPIDRNRVYATGISNGGLMSYRLACDAADVFAAVAPVAANLSVELSRQCHPASAISVLILNGTADPIMPWRGGTVSVFGSRRGEVVSADETFERLSALEACQTAPSAPRAIGASPDGTRVLEHRALCPRPTELVLLEIQGGGHTWPSGMPYLPVMIVGPVSHAIDGTQTIWAFFSRHALSAPAPSAGKV